MATKTISITEEAYERLAARKQKHESFSEVIKRMTNKVNLLDFAGFLTKEEADRLEAAVRAGRERSRKRLEHLNL